jgi:hypothetical protein
VENNASLVPKIFGLEESPYFVESIFSFDMHASNQSKEFTLQAILHQAWVCTL